MTAFFPKHYKILTGSQISTVTCLGGGLFQEGLLKICNARRGAYSRKGANSGIYGIIVIDNRLTSNDASK